MRTLLVALASAMVCAAPLTADNDQASPPAKVFFTADLGCLHCDYGIGDACAPCLKLDAKTPVVLGGKCASQLENDALSGKVVAIEGVLTRTKEGRLVLTSDRAAFVTAKEPGFADRGKAKISGTPVCGSCDLKVCDECTLAVANGAAPIILDGQLAVQHRADEAKHVTTFGSLFIDKRGLLRLQASKVEVQPK